MPDGEFWVYVVELDPSCVRAEGPKGAVYVGETASTPEERFAKHKAGHKAARVVKQHGLRLRPDLAPATPFLSRDSVLRAEERTARKLRNRHFTVYGGQGKPFMHNADA